MTRPLLGLALLGVIGGLAGAASLLASPARAATATFGSYISEVDACNRAQLPLPANAIVTRTRVRVGRQGGTVTYTCRVDWSDRSGTRPSYLPILF